MTPTTMNAVSQETNFYKQMNGSNTPVAKKETHHTKLQPAAHNGIYTHTNSTNPEVSSLFIRVSTDGHLKNWGLEFFGLRDPYNWDLRRRGGLLTHTHTIPYPWIHSIRSYTPPLPARFGSPRPCLPGSPARLGRRGRWPWRPGRWPWSWPPLPAAIWRSWRPWSWTPAWARIG